MVEVRVIAGPACRVSGAVVAPLKDRDASVQLEFWHQVRRLGQLLKCSEEDRRVPGRLLSPDVVGPAGANDE